MNAEAKLVEDCKSGSMAAYEELYNIHGARMRSMARNILLNPADAEDAVQDAFLKIYRSVPGFKGESAFTTWIFRILVNVCYDIARKKLRRRPEIQESDLELDLLESLSSDCADHPLRLSLEQSLSRLTDRSRTVFLLFEVEGFRHQEIAEIMNIPEGTSKSILFEAKRQLQRLLWDSAQSTRSAGETGM